jgi:phage protein D
MPTTAAYISRPTVLIDGQAAEGLMTDLVAFAAEESIAGMARCEARFHNFGTDGYRYFGRDTLDFGKAIAFTMGAGDTAAIVFSGKVTALEASFAAGGQPAVTVLAEDRLQSLRMTRRTRTFEDSSDSDVISQIASDHGLEANVDIEGPTHKVVAQLNQSDLAFIRARARNVDAELWVEDTTLHAVRRTGRTGDPVELSLGSGLIDLTVRADLAHQCSELGVAGWDASAKEAIEETAGPSDVSGELGNDVGGSSVLDEKLEARKERVVRATPTTTSEASGLAKAMYLERARRFVTGTGLADGDPRIRVGVKVRLQGVGPLFDGSYYVSRALHRFDQQNGYRTEFDVERAGIGAP